MKILKSIIIVSCLFFTSQIYSQTILIDTSALWSYYDNGDQPSDSGGFNWTDIDYDSSSWSGGNAELGYGDGDENTILDTLTSTAYFRKTFTVADSAAFDGIGLEILYDDGAVIYLNGTEIWRINMPHGTISYSTFASSLSSDNALAKNSISNNLVNGQNVIAVEIHQANSSSDDISFNFKLSGSIPNGENIFR